MPTKLDSQARAERQQASRKRAQERAKAKRKAQTAAKRAARAKLAREQVEYAAKMAAVLKAASAPKRETPKEYAARYYREVTAPRNKAARAARTEAELARIAEARSRAGSLAYANRKDRGTLPPAKPKPLKPADRIDWEALNIPTVHVHSHAARDRTPDVDDSPAASHWFNATRLTHKEI